MQTERTIIDLLLGISPDNEPIDRLEGKCIYHTTCKLHRVNALTSRDEVAEVLQRIVFVIVDDDIIEVEAIGSAWTQTIG